MSIQEEARRFVEAVSTAHSRHDENDVAQHGRIMRMETQWLEMQGIFRTTLKQMADDQREILKLLRTNGSGGTQEHEVPDGG